MFTYDLTTDIGKLRMLLRDTEDADAVFTDEELSTFLELESNLFHAAALALETSAADTVRTLQVGKLMDIQVDGAKMAEALLSIASRFRRRAEETEDWPGFEIAEQVDNSEFAYLEKLHKSKLRLA